MKIILINPAFNRYGGVKGHGGSVIPLNLCCLAAYVRKFHDDVELKILDSEVRDISHEETVEETAAFSPNLVGITTNTCVFDCVKELVRLLKIRLPDIPIVLGGTHVSALPERSLQECKADLVVRGEGELTFEEVVAQLKEGNSDWAKIDGLAYRDKRGEINVNPPRQLIEDLDVLPFPARDLVDNRLYIPAPTKRVSLGMNTLISASRGCPHNCGFCGSRTVWTRKVRTRSAESLVAEMKECAHNYDIRSFNFTDELFTSNKKRVWEICRLIRKEGLNIRWVCSARAQRLDLETLKMMKKAGCHEISFGIESGSTEILKRIDKGIKLDEALRVVRLTKKAGIITHASYMLGYIGETEETIRETIRFAKKLNTKVAAFFIASPLPGTRFYKEALEKGYLRSDATWQDYSPLSNAESVLELPNLSTMMIRKWHRKALRDYYFRPRYIISRLLAIRHWYEIVNLFAGLKIFCRIRK